MGRRSEDEHFVLQDVRPRQHIDRGFMVDVTDGGTEILCCGICGQDSIWIAVDENLLLCTL